MSVADIWDTGELQKLVTIDPELLGAGTDADYRFYYVDVSSVSEGKIDLPPVTIAFRGSPSRARKVVRRGDVLMATVRPNLKAFAYFDREIDDCVASTGFAVLRAKKGVDPRFVLYSILSEPVTRQIDALIVGSNYPAITTTSVSRLTILTPPTAEQSKIAEVLSTVDRAIAQTEALIAKQQRIKAGLMQDLLTRGIDEHGHLRSEATHAFKGSPLGRIPVEWECDSIVNSTDQIMDFRGRTPKKLGSDWGGEIPALSAMNVEMGKLNFQKHTNFGDDDLYRRWMTHGDAKKGDVIMTTEAPLGNVAQIPNNERYILSQRVILLRGKVEAMDNNYMRHYLGSPLFRKTMHEQSSGTTATGIQRRKLEQLLIRVPPVHEQANIAAVIDGCDGEIEAAINQSKKFCSLKTALMQDLLTGKVRVTPLLEPAGEASA